MNKAEKQEYNRAYRENNRERLKAQRIAYYENLPAEQKAALLNRNKIYRQQHKLKMDEYREQWCRKNADKLKDRRLHYYAENREHLCKLNRARHANRRDDPVYMARRAAYTRKYLHADRERKRAIEKRRNRNRQQNKLWMEMVEVAAALAG